MLYSKVINIILVILTIYTTVLGDVSWTWRDGKIDYKLNIGMLGKKQSNYLNIINCALILQGDTKHILTLNQVEQPLDTFAILTRLSRYKYSKLSYDLYLIILNMLVVTYPKLRQATSRCYRHTHWSLGYICK